MILEQSISEKTLSMPVNDQPNFLNKSGFSTLVEKAVFKKKISYMEAILLICDKNNIEPEDVKKFLNGVIVEKVEAEAMNLNFLPRQNMLIFED